MRKAERGQPEWEEENRDCDFAEIADGPLRLSELVDVSLNLYVLHDVHGNFLILFCVQ